MPRRKRLQSFKNFQYIEDEDSESGRKWKKTKGWKEFVR